MNPGPHGSLSRRERQVMEVLFRGKTLSVEEIRAGIPSPPSYSAVRSTINILERKGYLRHVPHGKKYLYSPTTARKKAIRGAVQHLVSTYFDNSMGKAVSAMLELHRDDMDAGEIEKLTQMIAEKKKKRTK